MGTLLLPHKRVRQLQNSFELMSKRFYLKFKFVNIENEKQFINFEAVWDGLNFQYVEKLTSSDKKILNKKQVTVIKVSPKQFTFAKYAIEALSNDLREIPIQDIILHGGRRTGKSVSLSIAVFLVMLLKPASNILILGLRKHHGKKILKNVKKWLNNVNLWNYEDRESRLTLFNSSVMISRSVVEFDTERGDSYTIIIYDEAGFMKEQVYNALSSSVIDQNGFNIMASTPPEDFNWFYDKYKNKDNKDKAIRESVRVVGISILENSFLSKAVKKRALLSASTLSSNVYKREIEGKFLPTAGLVFEEFNKKIHLATSQELKKKGIIREDTTINNTDLILGVESSYIVGCDFNFNPSTAVILKIYDNNIVYVEKEVLSKGSVEKFGLSIIDNLKYLGLTEDQALEVPLIVDASSRYQGVGKTIRKTKAWNILKEVGFINMFTPKRGNKRNPPLADRMDIMRSLLMTVSGEIKIFINPENYAVIDMFEKLVLKDGLPDKRSPFAHMFDALGYPLYRFFIKSLKFKMKDQDYE